MRTLKTTPDGDTPRTRRITHEQIASAFYVPDSWAKLAVIDRLVELHYIVPISRDGARQDYVYRWTGKR